jgi:hypothetical protein
MSAFHIKTEASVRCKNLINNAVYMVSKIAELSQI